MNKNLLAHGLEAKKSKTKIHLTGIFLLCHPWFKVGENA
jgi:hypothetical protein